MSRIGITRRFAALLVLAICLNLVLTALLRSSWTMSLPLYVLAVGLAVVDYLLTPGAKWFDVQRQLPRSFEQRQQSDIFLTVRSKGPQHIKLRLTDSPPQTFGGGGQILNLYLETATVSGVYSVTPTRRGVFSFGRCYLEVYSRWGFSTKRFSRVCPGEGAVYPNLSAMRYYRMLTERRQLSWEDSALHRVRALGAEFAGIREYTPDDDWRKINWKATARTKKLMTNIYEMEKNREVILAVDLGRWMQASQGGVTRLDRALEMAAALMQVALSSGDKVGLVLYHMEAVCYIAPGKGSFQAGKILSALYDAQATNWPSSAAAFSGILRQKLTKRAFVCVLTYLDSVEEAAITAKELAPIVRRHSIFFSSLADEGLEELVDKKAAAPADIYLKAAAVHRKQSVLAAAEYLRRNGIAAYVAEPVDLLTHSIRHYLSQKGRPQ